MTLPPDDEDAPVPPELPSNARQMLDIEVEMWTMLATGGVPFEVVIAEVEAAMREPL